MLLQTDIVINLKMQNCWNRMTAFVLQVSEYREGIISQMAEMFKPIIKESQFQTEEEEILKIRLKIKTKTA